MIVDMLKKIKKNCFFLLTEFEKDAILDIMESAMKEKIKRHAFQVYLTQSESERLDAYLNRTGMKKYAVVQKAIIKYLDDNELEAKN